MVRRLTFSIPIVCLLACGWATTSAFAAGGISLRAATAISVSSGKPLFAVYGTKTCPHCVALMNRLKTDESLTPFADKFVVMKIETDDPDWPVFDRRYRIDKNAIPRLYIIGSTGNAIAKQVGAPSGDDLPVLLLESLKKGSPMLEPARAKLIEAIAQRISELDPETDWAEIAFHYFTIEDDLVSGNLGWESIKEASEKFATAQATLSETLLDTRKKVADGTSDVPTLVTWAKAASLYEASSTRRQQGTALMRELKKVKVDRGLLNDAIALGEVETLAYRDDKRFKRRAANRLKQLVNSTENQQVVERATALLAELDPDYKLDLSGSKPNSASANEPDFRLWNAASGDFSKTAKLVQSNASHVQLEDQRGNKITVLINLLSDSDQNYIAEHASK